MRVLRTTLAAAALLAPAVALAGPWDWPEEFQSRHWRTATLDWASNARYDHPSHAYLQANYAPPAHEMWCHFEEEPVQADFDIHKVKLEAWLHIYLNIPVQDPLPGLPPFPAECV